MKMYRVYFLDDEGHVYGADIADCASDGEAARRGTALMARRHSAGVEIWEGARRVAYAQGRLGCATA